MRIINGKNKGRVIKAPANLPVRPTTDLGKESIFNIINNYFNFDAVTVLDLFSGTGNITYEFGSRGARAITAIDNFQGCTDFIRETVTKLDYKQVAVVRSDAFQFLERCRTQFDIVFADPPYDLKNVNKVAELVFEKQILNPDGWLIIEHAAQWDFSEHPNFYQHRQYGKLNFTILVNFTQNEQN